MVAIGYRSILLVFEPWSCSDAILWWLSWTRSKSYRRRKRKWCWCVVKWWKRRTMQQMPAWQAAVLVTCEWCLEPAQASAYIQTSSLQYHAHSPAAPFDDSRWTLVCPVAGYSRRQPIQISLSNQCLECSCALLPWLPMLNPNTCFWWLESQKHQTPFASWQLSQATLAGWHWLLLWL